MVLSDKAIKALCTPPYHFYGERRVSELLTAMIENTEIQGIGPMITPFHSESVKLNDAGHGIASYGVSSYGYDIRAAGEFKVFRHAPEDGVLDYKNMDDSLFEQVTADEVIIPPNGFILARSVEYVRIPENVIALCIGKSTIARVGINCLCTPLEPGWEGHITLEFSNTTNLPNRFYANEGVLQLVFLRGVSACDVSYRDRQGKYQNQGSEIILPRV